MSITLLQQTDSAMMFCIIPTLTEQVVNQMVLTLIGLIGVTMTSLLLMNRITSVMAEKYQLMKMKNRTAILNFSIRSFVKV